MANYYVLKNSTLSYLYFRFYCLQYCLSLKFYIFFNIFDLIIPTNPCEYFDLIIPTNPFEYFFDLINSTDSFNYYTISPLYP